MLGTIFKRGKNSDKSYLQKFTLFFFDRPRFTAILWLIVLAFGIASYTSLLKREGFPPTEVPYTVINGTYLVNNSQKVDQDVSKKLSQIILNQKGVKTVNAQSFPNFFVVFAQYQNGTDASSLTKEIESEAKKTLPPQVVATYDVPSFGYTSRGDDLLISFYSTKPRVSIEQLSAKSKEAVEYLKNLNLSDYSSISAIDPISRGVDPVTGQNVSRIQNFNWYGEKTNGSSSFYNTVDIGLMKKDSADLVKSYEQAKQAVEKLNSDSKFKDYRATISASFAPGITAQIDELQVSLLEGLLAVLIVGSLVIAIRASLITVLSMVTVLAATLGFMELIGYTLNTITLFSLILALALIVDDTIIMVEAIDAQRRHQKDRRKAIEVATKKVSRAMIAATSTAALSFAPLLFVSGLLGGFIRAIPVTIISALVISLFVALIFIPLFAKFILLGKKQLGENVHEMSAGFEAKLAAVVAYPMLWARNSKKKLTFVGLGALLVSLLFIIGGIFIFRQVNFNIFPPTKDSNVIVVNLTFAPDLDTQKATAVANKANIIVSDTLGEYFVRSTYYSTGTSRDATMYVDITPYSERDVKAPELVSKMNSAFNNFKSAQVKVNQQDVGPPAAPFTVRVQSDNLEKSYLLAQDIAKFLKKVELTRISGEKANIKTVAVSNPGISTRVNGELSANVNVEFEDSDTTTLFGLAQDAIEKEYTSERLSKFGLSKENIKFDVGFESENQESFNTLLFAFPILLIVIYVLLAFQFRSFLQPLLIFMAIPFSLFGISLGLYLTDNPFSFFAMLGFFALVGLSIKNSILLTDFANQARRAGMSAVDSAHAALEERFRPLIATSLTAIVSLIPLAFASPFWEGLVVVLIGGLLSSTLLVVTVFPYFYLGAEFLRIKSRKLFRKKI